MGFFNDNSISPFMQIRLKKHKHAYAWALYVYVKQSWHLKLMQFIKFIVAKNNFVRTFLLYLVIYRQVWHTLQNYVHNFFWCQFCKYVRFLIE